MYSEFEQLFKSLFVKKGFKNRWHGYKCNLVYDERTKRKEYRKILDRVAIGVIYDAFDDEKLIAALLKLARVERIIIAFNIILQMELPEIAFILDASLSSTYAQKSTALKRLKEEIESIAEN